MAEATDVEITPIEDVEPETVANYKAPAKKTIDELNTMDADDESLVNFFEKSKKIKKFREAVIASCLDVFYPQSIRKVVIQYIRVRIEINV